MPVQKIYATFSKKGDMRFISHLDLMRLFQRALRRAGLPFFLTKGFNPRPKISFNRALKLGIESEAEEAAFYMDTLVDLEDFKNKLNAQIPDGVRITTCKN